MVDWVGKIFAWSRAVAVRKGEAPQCAMPVGGEGRKEPSPQPPLQLPFDFKSAGAKWVEQWTLEGGTAEGGFKAKLPSPAVVKQFTPYRELGIMTVYRAHLKGSEHGPVESWTTERGLAEAIVSTDAKRIILSRDVHHSEVLVDISKLPELFQEKVGVPSEVIVANGDYAENMAKLRGEKLVIGAKLK